MLPEGVIATNEQGESMNTVIRKALTEYREKIEQKVKPKN